MGVSHARVELHKTRVEVELYHCTMCELGCADLGLKFAKQGLNCTMLGLSCTKCSKMVNFNCTEVGVEFHQQFNSAIRTSLTASYDDVCLTLGDVSEKFVTQTQRQRQILSRTK